MSYFTTDTYELKREIVNFADRLSFGLSQVSSKFIHDMIYGLAKNQSVLISNISRALDESVNLTSTIDRLCTHLDTFSDHDLQMIKTNYFHMVHPYIEDEPIVLLDNSDIVKKYGKKFEDLSLVRDASSPNEDIYPGYHVCEATVMTKKEKQPISLYSHIYSTESNGFISMNDETFKSIEAVKAVINRRCTFVMDRGYDANEYYEYFIKKNKMSDDFIIRIQDRRLLAFKGKMKKVGDIAIKRKGKVKMEMYFSEENQTVYASHTRVELPKPRGIELYLVMVYGLSEERPLLLLTNKKIKGKHDLHQAVRSYMKRWRIEEGFRFKKQQYDFENMRVRSLRSINMLNIILMMHIGHIGMMAEKINRKLLIIKIIERGRSIKPECYFWLYQIARGIKEILKYAHSGIKGYEGIRKRKEYQQIALKLN